MIVCQIFLNMSNGSIFLYFWKRSLARYTPRNFIYRRHMTTLFDLVFLLLLTLLFHPFLMLLYLSASFLIKAHLWADTWFLTQKVMFHLGSCFTAQRIWITLTKISQHWRLWFDICQCILRFVLLLPMVYWFFDAFSQNSDHLGIKVVFVTEDLCYFRGLFIRLRKHEHFLTVFQLYFELYLRVIVLVVDVRCGIIMVRSVRKRGMFKGKILEYELTQLLLAFGRLWTNHLNNPL